MSGAKPILAALAVAFLALALAGPLDQATTAQLLVNGGFEGGTASWQARGGSLTTVAMPVRSGQAAGAFTVIGQQLHEVLQAVDVQGGGEYSFGGHLAGGALSASAFLRISWYGEPGGFGSPIGHEDSSSSVTLGEADTYRNVVMSGATAPAAARSARVRVLVNAAEGAVVYLDDLSFTGSPPTSPPPPATPTPTVTPPPTPSPTPAPPTVVTPPPTSTPTPLPTAAPLPTSSPTPSPVPTPTSPTATPATPSPTPRPTRPSPTPTRSPLLPLSPINPSFEEAVEGVLVGWRKFGGELRQVAQPRAHGSFAAALSSFTTATKWIFQPVAVSPGAYYSLSALALKNDTNIQALFLRISWYPTADASGSLIKSDDSPLLTSDSPSFQPLTTGPVQAPPDARSARVRLMLRPASSAPATAFSDHVQWQETTPPPATPAPTPTSTPTATPVWTPAPTAPQSPTPSVTPLATPTPIPTATPSPTPAASVTPTPSPTARPISTVLINPSFEEASGGRIDAWDALGGELRQVAQPRAHGSFAAALSSNTTATKWIFQPVAVSPGAYYSLSALALKNDTNIQALFLRISWYPTADASGSLIKSDDSPLLTSDSPSFQPLTTGPVQAPPDARSARVRLMLRPASSAPATAFSDHVQWQETTPPPATPAPTPTSTPTATPVWTPAPTAPQSPTPSVTPLATPTPIPTATPSPTPAASVTPTPSPT
ncbi:MAG: hypothetical protein ACE5IZ_05710, partial [Dehalococcoidia bacterium]